MSLILSYVIGSNMKNKRAIIIALVLAVFAVFAHKMYIDKKIQSIVGPYEKLPVVVAIQDVDLNSRIESSALSLEYIPKKFVQPGSIQNVSEAVGYLAAVSIKKGEQVLKNKLVEYEEAFLALRVPEGKRAVTLAVNDVTGVAGLPKPGNHVDILVSFSFGREDSMDKRIKTIFQNVMVLAVGQNYRFISSPMSGERSEREKLGSIKNITIALTPYQCQHIILAQQVGLITITLRPHFEEPIIEDLPIDNIYSITGTKEPLTPQKKAPYLEIRGSTFEATY